ncbi:MAG: DUF481 domain-containing protein [Stenotrophobium sp.]
MLGRIPMAAAVMAISGVMTPVIAQAANGFGGELSAGYLATGGNSNTRSLNAKGVLNYTRDAWKNVFIATALGGAEKGAATAERYTADDKLNYSFTEHDYAFGEADWEKDLFGPVGLLTTETVGYGRNILTGPVHTLDGEIGVGARQQIINGSDQHENDGILQFGANYGWKISDTSAFGEKLKIDTGRANTYTESITELKVSIVGNLFTTLSYTFRHNSVAAAGFGKTDTITAISLAYVFGVK